MSYQKTRVVNTRKSWRHNIYSLRTPVTTKVNQHCTPTINTSAYFSSKYFSVNAPCKFRGRSILSWWARVAITLPKWLPCRRQRRCASSVEIITTLWFQTAHRLKWFKVTLSNRTALWLSEKLPQSTRTQVYCLWIQIKLPTSMDDNSLFIARKGWLVFIKSFLTVPL